jgi:glycosyltransferase involved in cell wall biosynthesis
MKYSFCITTRNDFSTIKDSLGSLFSQLPKSSEVVIIDAESDDGQWEYLSQLWKLHMIELGRTKCNRGEGRQIAFRFSRGEYIISQMDTDDVLNPNLERLLSLYHSDFEGYLLAAGLDIAPRSLLEKLGGWRPLYGLEDLDLRNRAKALGKLREISFPIFKSKEKNNRRRQGKGFLTRAKHDYLISRSALSVGVKPKLTWKSEPLWWLAKLRGPEV